jgi:hypothetical protein
MPSPHLPEGFDFLDPDRNVVRLPIDELAELRKTAPVWWCEQKIGKGGFNDGGYWVVTKHKDVTRRQRYLSRHRGMGENWSDPTSAGALSQWILWNKPTFKASLSDYKRRFKL